MYSQSVSEINGSKGCRFVECVDRYMDAKAETTSLTANVTRHNKNVNNLKKKHGTDTVKAILRASVSSLRIP